MGLRERLLQLGHRSGPALELFLLRFQYLALEREVGRPEQVCFVGILCQVHSVLELCSAVMRRADYCGPVIFNVFRERMRVRRF